MIQQLQHIQRHGHMQNPLPVEHKQRKDQDAGHSWYVKEAGLVDAEEKELGQHQAGAQILVKRIRADPCDMQKPHADAARCHQHHHPELPCHDQRNQAQHSAEYRGNDSQQQMSACLFLCPHCFSNS